MKLAGIRRFQTAVLWKKCKKFRMNDILLERGDIEEQGDVFISVLIKSWTIYKLLGSLKFGSF